jgi:hypothetical protein
MNAVQLEVGKALLGNLRGFRKAPVGDGFNRFAEVLCECSISVEHAMAIVETFDYEFPTLRDIRDAAHNLRPRFDAKVDKKKEWEAKYGKPDPAFLRRITGATGANYVQERRAILWQSIRDAIFYTETSMGRQDLASIDDKNERINAFKFWKQAAVNNQRNHPVEVASFCEQLDSNWDELMAYDWVRGDWPPSALASVALAPVALANPITQTDVDRELGRVGRESGDGE